MISEFDNVLREENQPDKSHKNYDQDHNFAHGHQRAFASSAF